MRLETFEMERWQSIWENQVRYNLSESGVHSMSVGEVVPAHQLLDDSLGYPQTNGSQALRDVISQMYSGANSEQVLVTNGAAEANFLAIWNLLEPGDELVMMVPNYMQIWGIAKSFGCVPQAWHLREDHNWAPDLGELKQLVSKRTKVIAVCNPNNPTGAILSDNDMREICRIAGTVGAWVLADEVYRGAELDGPETTSFFGMYERVLAVCGLSKAYGLPGLRIGWLVGSTEKIADLWRYKDHTSICVGGISDRMAQLALRIPTRQRILGRTRDILRKQLPILVSWAATHGPLFSWAQPRAGAFGYLRYNLELNSSELARALRDDKSVLVVPGDHFGMDHFVRIGFGHDPGSLKDGLACISDVLKVYQSRDGIGQTR